MKKSIYISENAAMLSMLDSEHQEQFKFFTEQTSVWFQNVLLKTLLQHKCSTTGCEGASEEDIKVLTHADKTIILMYLSLYLISKLNPVDEAMKEKVGDLRQFHGDDQVESLLLVLYNLLDIDYDEFRHHGPDFLESNSKMIN